MAPPPPPRALSRRRGCEWGGLSRLAPVDFRPRGPAEPQGRSLGGTRTSLLAHTPNVDASSAVAAAQFPGQVLGGAEAPAWTGLVSSPLVSCKAVVCAVPGNLQPCRLGALQLEWTKPTLANVRVLHWLGDGDGGALCSVTPSHIYGKYKVVLIFSLLFSLRNSLLALQ